MVQARISRMQLVFVHMKWVTLSWPCSYVILSIHLLGISIGRAYLRNYLRVSSDSQYLSPGHEHCFISAHTCQKHSIDSILWKHGQPISMKIHVEKGILIAVSLAHQGTVPRHFLCPIHIINTWNVTDLRAGALPLLLEIRLMELFIRFRSKMGKFHSM